MNAHLQIQTHAPSGDIALRSIDERDLEDLRRWKNANAERFFFKQEITPDMQRRWYDGYLARPADFMFVVEHENVKLGCMGFRLIDAVADCYNIIGVPERRLAGAMSAAMAAMCSYVRAEHTTDVGCIVLKTNPAITWYECCGFRIVGEESGAVRMRLDPTRFSARRYSRNP